MKFLKYLLIFVPLSFIAKFMNASDSIMFLLSCASIIPLAGLMGEGTEEISFYSGPKVGGFLNGTFGNATELIISFFALKKGLFEVVTLQNIEHSTAVLMALKDKMDVGLEIALGSSLQIILFVAPVLIFISLLFTPMSIIFNQFEIIALIASVVIINNVSNDGESNYLEGLQLLAVYLIIAAAFFIV